MKNNPLISVIVPIYKVEKFLPSCIDSILAQTYQNLEIILVDDGSPDNCGLICDQYAKKDSRIVVIHKENGGLSDARNAGLDICKGEYIAFVDSDDLLHQDFVNALLCNIADCDMILCRYRKFVDEESLDHITGTQGLQVFTGFALLENMNLFSDSVLIVAWNKLYKKEIWQALRYPIGRLHEDEYVIHHILGKCETVGVLDSRLYYYRQREDSITAVMTPKRYIDCMGFYLDREDFYKERKMISQAKQIHASRLYFSLKHRSLDGKSQEKNLKINEIFFNRNLLLKTKFRLLARILLG